MCLTFLVPCCDVCLRIVVSNTSWGRHVFYWWRKPTNCRKSLTNFITYCCIVYTSPRTRLECTTLVVIGTARLVVNPTTIRSWTWRPQDVFDTTIRKQTSQHGTKNVRHMIGQHERLERAVPITTNVVHSNLVRGEVYTIQQYVIKFVSDLRQLVGFLHQ
jgi:hypothetical protein